MAASPKELRRYATDFNSSLHHLRTDELRRTGPENGVVISVGCSDLTYFDWVHQNLGIPRTHIALEFYREKPTGLPATVEWIPNTAGNMRDVPTGCADLLFAGQVVEHLWPEELAGFFFEAARVLKPAAGWSSIARTKRSFARSAGIILSTLSSSVPRTQEHFSTTLGFGSREWSATGSADLERAKY
jgi:hypothetical protein